MTNEPDSRKYRSGCLVPLGIYIGLIVIGFFVTRPPLITGDFSGNIAGRFSIAITDEVDGQETYQRRTLEWVLEHISELPEPGFLLAERKIIIDNGDIQRVAVLEEHDDWQLIKFSYSNGYTSTSIYRAYTGRVEPVSYQMTSSFADVIMIFVLVLPAYLLAWIATFFRNKSVRSRA